MKIFSLRLIEKFSEPLFHVTVAIAPYIWAQVLTVKPIKPAVLVWLSVFALLPDIDTAASLLGRTAPAASWLEANFGHRTITHSLLAVAVLAVWLRLLAPPIYGWLVWAYISHLLVDITTSKYGVQLLYPAPYFVTLANLPSRPLLVLLWLLLVPALVMPARTAAEAAAIAPALQTPTPTPTPPPVPANFPPCVPLASAVRVQVVRVIDGDTIIVRYNDGTTDSVRFLGVNAPEIAHPAYGKPTAEPFGDAARLWLTAHITPTVFVATDPQHEARDKYGRLLAYVVAADGRFLNLALLHEGLARLFMSSNLSCENELATAAASAQLQGVGIWSAPTPTPKPTPTPTPTVGFDYQAALLELQEAEIGLQITAVCATATAQPWRYNQHWLDWQLQWWTLKESEAHLRLQAWLAAHPPTPTPTPTPAPAP